MPRGEPTERTRDRQQARLWLVRALAGLPLAAASGRSPCDVLRAAEPRWAATPGRGREALALELAGALGLPVGWVAEVVAATLDTWQGLDPAHPHRAALVLPNVSAGVPQSFVVVPAGADARDDWEARQWAEGRRLLVETGDGLALDPPPAPPPRPPSGRLLATATCRRDVEALARFVAGESLATVAARLGLARPVALRALGRAAAVVGLPWSLLAAGPGHRAGRPRKPRRPRPQR